MEFASLTTFQIELLLMITLAESGAGFWLWRQVSSVDWEKRHSPSGPDRRRAYLQVLALLLLLVIAANVGSLLSHFDRPWYSVRAVTGAGWILSPAHYFIFLNCYPAYIFLGFAMYVLLKRRIPDLLTKIRWPLLISVVVPFMFIPALDGNLLDQSLTLFESFYITSFWLANFVWIVFGILPIGATALKCLVIELGPRDDP